MLGAVVLSLLLGIYVYSINIFPNKNQDGAKIKEKIGIGIITSEEKEAAKFQAFADYLNKWSGDSLIWKKMARDNPNIINELQILATGGPFPEKTFIISADLGQNEIIELKDLLTKATDSDEGRDFLNKMEIDRFIDTDKSDFIEVKKITNF